MEIPEKFGKNIVQLFILDIVIDFKENSNFLPNKDNHFNQNTHINFKKRNVFEIDQNKVLIQILLIGVIFVFLEQILVLKHENKEFG